MKGESRGEPVATRDVTHLHSSPALNLKTELFLLFRFSSVFASHGLPAQTSKYVFNHWLFNLRAGRNFLIQMREFWFDSNEYHTSHDRFVKYLSVKNSFDDFFFTRWFFNQFQQPPNG